MDSGELVGLRKTFAVRTTRTPNIALKEAQRCCSETTSAKSERHRNRSFLSLAGFPRETIHLHGSTIPGLYMYSVPQQLGCNELLAAKQNSGAHVETTNSCRGAQGGYTQLCALA